MLEIGSSYVPNAKRTHLVKSTEDAAQRCDVFRIEYKTQDDVNHEYINTLTVRFAAHKIQGKHYVVVGIYETLDEKVRQFVDCYKDERLIIHKYEFEFNTGAVVCKKEYVCMLESGLIPYHCDSPDKPVMFELVFREV